MKKMMLTILVATFLLLVALILLVTSPSVNSRYYSDKLYCLKSSDCMEQATVQSECCGNQCTEIVNKYNFEEVKFTCSEGDCEDPYSLCPVNFEVRCVNRQCKKVIDF